jgi:hypothetical protein
MAMLIVVPTHKAEHPAARLLDGGEAVWWIAGRIFAGAEPRLNVRVVVRYPGPAMRRPDSQRFQFRLERVGRLRRAVVRMQNQRLLSALFTPARAFNQCGRIVAACPLMHFPGDQLAAKNVEHRIQIEELPRTLLCSTVRPSISTRVLFSLLRTSSTATSSPHSL